MITARKFNEKFIDKKICIVSNDAGGAKILKSQMNIMKCKFKFILTGPALNIFNKKKNKPNIVKNIKSCDFVFTGTSGRSNLEFNVIKHCNKINKQVYSFLDHWVNYEKRFIRNNEIVLPTQIVVFDKYAFKIAKKYFYKVLFVEKNPYWDELKKKIKIKKKSQKLKTILYVSSNFDRVNDKRYSDYDILKKFLKYTDNQKKFKKIIIRTHPSEDLSKYKKILINLPKIEFDKNKELINSIKKADIICGHNSMAMVSGHFCGLKTININLKGIKNTIPKIYIDESI
jgi:hypothetical protein